MTVGTQAWACVLAGLFLVLATFEVASAHHACMHTYMYVTPRHVTSRDATPCRAAHAAHRTMQHCRFNPLGCMVANGWGSWLATGLGHGVAHFCCSG